MYVVGVAGTETREVKSTRREHRGGGEVGRRRYKHRLLTLAHKSWTACADVSGNSSDNGSGDNEDDNEEEVEAPDDEDADGSRVDAVLVTGCAGAAANDGDASSKYLLRNNKSIMTPKLLVISVRRLLIVIVML